MKKSFYLTLLLISAFTIIFNACKKEQHKKCNSKEKKETGCCNVKARADMGCFSYTHFVVLEGADEGLNLYITNIGEYSNQIIPGETYMIGYEMVECPACVNNWNRCGTKNPDGTFDPNGPFLCRPILKCAKITCFKKLNTNYIGCGLAIEDKAQYNNHTTMAENAARIVGDKLYVTCSFTGCSLENAPEYTLYLSNAFQLNYKPNLLLAKVGFDSPQNYTCQAQFSKEYCFDLSNIKSNYNKTMQPGQMILNIEIEYLNGSSEILEYPVN